MAFHPVVNTNIKFRQGETEILGKLDKTGTTWFGKDIFKTGVPMTAELIFPGRKVPPITFTLDPEETVYVLQEVKGPQSFSTILLEILAAIGAFIGLVGAFLLGGFLIDIVTDFISNFLRTL
jgi:hypothetical protein